MAGRYSLASPDSAPHGPPRRSRTLPVLPRTLAGGRGLRRRVALQPVRSPVHPSGGNYRSPTDQTLSERPDLPKESLLDQGTMPLPPPAESFLSHASVAQDTSRPPYQPAAKDEVELRGDTILGDYRIVRKLGQGGMAVVYLARHLHLDREVAIKVLPGAFLRSKEAIDRLLREARSGLSCGTRTCARF